MCVCFFFFFVATSEDHKIQHTVCIKMSRVRIDVPSTLRPKLRPLDPKPLVLFLTQEKVLKRWPKFMSHSAAVIPWPREHGSIGFDQ